MKDKKLSLVSYTLATMTLKPEEKEYGELYTE